MFSFADGSHLSYTSPGAGSTEFLRRRRCAAARRKIRQVGPRPMGCEAKMPSHFVRATDRYDHVRISCASRAPAALFHRPGESRVDNLVCLECLRRALEKVARL